MVSVGEWYVRAAEAAIDEMLDEHKARAFCEPGYWLDPNNASEAHARAIARAHYEANASSGPVVTASSSPKDGGVGVRDLVAVDEPRSPAKSPTRYAKYLGKRVPHRSSGCTTSVSTAMADAGVQPERHRQLRTRR